MARIIGVGELLGRKNALRARTVGELAMPLLSQGRVFHHHPALCRMLLQMLVNNRQTFSAWYPITSLYHTVLTHKQVQWFLPTLLIPLSLCSVPGQP